MHHSPTPYPAPHAQPRALPCSTRRQQGISLLMVMIMLLLTALLTTGTLLIANFNETMVGNHADIQRAQAAVEALVADAERSIITDGIRCTGATCRFPKNKSDMDRLYSAIGTMNTCGTSGTYKGICIVDNPNNPKFAGSAIVVGDFASGQSANNNPLNRDSALHYADFGRGTNTGSASLQLGQRGMYWIEVYSYASTVSSGGLSEIPVPDISYPFIFRITAYAPGLKPGTGSIVRSFYVPRPVDAQSLKEGT